MTAHTVDYYMNTPNGTIVRCACGWKDRAPTIDGVRRSHELHARDEDRKKGTR